MTAIALRDLPRVTAGEEGALKEAISNLFRDTYAFWTEPQCSQAKPVREALEAAYFAILTNVPSSPARTRALNCLTDARMLANQAITFEGEV